LNYLFVKKKLSFSLYNRQSEAGFAILSFITPSNQKPKEAKSASYTRLSYTTVLATKGSFINKSDLGIIDISKSLCQTLLGKEQTVL
jgi:hypothetical protein